MVFCSGRNGTASYDWTDPATGTDLKPLFDTILKYVQPPEGEPDEPLQMLVSSVDYNDFVGRMGVGRVQNGVIKVGSPIQVCDWHNPDVHMSGRITKLFDFKANGREPIESAAGRRHRRLCRSARYFHRQHRSATPARYSPCPLSRSTILRWR